VVFIRLIKDVVTNTIRRYQTTFDVWFFATKPRLYP